MYLYAFVMLLINFEDGAKLNHKTLFMSVEVYRSPEATILKVLIFHRITRERKRNHLQNSEDSISHKAPIYLRTTRKGNRNKLQFPQRNQGSSIHKMLIFLGTTLRRKRNRFQSPSWN